MRKKNVLLIVAFSLLLLSITLYTPIGTQLPLQIINPVEADPKTIMVPTNYTKIQDAINAAEPGDTIYVYNGTYYEHVVVNKTVTLIGENKSTTIIDGEGTIVIRSSASDVEISGFTIQNGGDSPNSGMIIGSCVNNTIRDNIIRNNAYGITLSVSNGCRIISNLIINCSWAGIQILNNSSNNDIYENTIVNNSWGVEILYESAFNNTFYHNNFIDNLVQVQSFAPTTKWDNGTEGNYWSDYTGEDSNNDSIGDTLYTIKFVGADNCPLMKPFGNIGDLARPIIGTPHQEPLEPSDGEDVTISVNVTDKESGVHNVTLSYSINKGANWTDVPMINLTGNTYEGKIPGLQNGTNVWYRITAYDNAGNFVVDDNATQYYVYTVVPEFSATIFLPLFIILTLVAVVVRKRKKGAFKL